MGTFTVRTEVNASADELFAWHARPGAFERLVPPWERVRVVERTGGLEDGARVVLEMRLGPLPVRWTAVHRDVVAGRQFVDEQEGGPFRAWRHTHRMIPAGPERSTLEDHVEFELPLGPVGRLAEPWAVRRRLARTFRYRHEVTRADVEAHRAAAHAGRLRVAVTGATGLVGARLVPFLTTGGHDVVRLVRGEGWNPATGEIDGAIGGSLDAVVHLAGAGIADRRWSAAWKREIRESRVGPTRRLCERLAGLERRPKVLVCASAIGLYGDRGDEPLTEASPAGTGFLPEVCVEWEQATAPAREAGIRVVNLRIGIVLSPAGGALLPMLRPFRAGLGGRLGSGRQVMSWVGIDDVVGAIHHALCTPALQGPVNATAPKPVTNAAFTATLARVLTRPALFPVPGAALRLAFGEMAGPLLLGGQRVLPRRLLDAGYAFRHGELEPALRHLLGRA